MSSLLARRLLVERSNVEVIANHPWCFETKEDKRMCVSQEELGDSKASMAWLKCRDRDAAEECRD